MALLFLSAEGAIAHASGVPQYRQPEIPAKSAPPRPDRQLRLIVLDERG